MSDEAITQIELTIAPKWLGVFGRLLSDGFVLTVQTGVSVGTLLCEQLGIEADYVANRIQTVFLNSQAVDDVDRAAVPDGAVLALSAAMPGLVGAVMRRGGVYAGLRSGISYRPESAPKTVKPGSIKLKLFNMVAKELGPRFLAQGLRIKSRAFEAFLRDQPDDFKQGIAAARVDGRPLEPSGLFEMQWPTKEIQLAVKAL
jgi:hypothetical protein